MACPATRHMARTHHTGTVPGAAGGYVQPYKRIKYRTRLQPLVIETGGRMHRDTVQFVHARQARQCTCGCGSQRKNRAAATTRELRGAWLERHHIRCMARLIRELARRRRRREQERQLGIQCLPAGHREREQTCLVCSTWTCMYVCLYVCCWCHSGSSTCDNVCRMSGPFNVCMSCANRLKNC